MERLEASAQYDDWVGTAAADNQTPAGIERHLREHGLMKEGQFLMGFTVDVSEMGGREKPTINALISDEAGTYDDIQPKLAGRRTLLLHRVSVEISLTEFLRLFARFNLVLTKKGLNLQGLKFKEA
jgi:hypothetical protein